MLEQLAVDLETLKRNWWTSAANSGLLKNYEELEKLESTLSSAEEEKSIVQKTLMDEHPFRRTRKRYFGSFKGEM